MDKSLKFTKLNNVLGIGFLIKASYEGLLLSGKQYKLDSSRISSDHQVYAYLHNDDAPERANPPYRPSQSNRVAIPPSYDPPVTMDTKSPSIGRQKPYQTLEKPISLNCEDKVQEKASELSTSTTMKKTKKPPKPKIDKKESNGSVMSSVLTTTAVLDSDNSQTSQYSYKSLPSRQDSQKSIASLTSDSQDSMTPLPTPDFTLTPGSFEVVLVMDNREVFGAGASKDTMVTDIKKNQIPMDVRPLSIGDFTWIARRKSGPFDSINKSEELVLDYIIERKRMDDLASSIVDGRFKEQKFRLKNCGLKKPIYLVEDYGSVQHFSINQEALNQAIVNTQVIDNFYVKRTRDVKESVAYLTIMTRYLQSIYGHKTLHACSKRELDKHSISSTVTDSEARLLTFQEFDKLSVKSRKLTVQENFGKLLVQMNGITAEKAAAVVGKYPTPYSLIEAYRKCTTQKEKEALLMSVKFGALNRNIGQQLSKVIYWLYSRHTLS